MKELTQEQKNFLLLSFFRDEEYAGWESIATMLLDTGKCIVAGKGCIWVGDIGNFIETEEAKDAVDCTLYKFDLELFLKSDFFKEYKNEQLLIYSRQIESLQKGFDEISSI